MKKEIEKLETQLISLKKIHSDMWEIYGSELCTGDMLAKEQNLEDLIKTLKDTNENEEC